MEAHGRVRRSFQTRLGGAYLISRGVVGIPVETSHAVDGLVLVFVVIYEERAVVVVVVVIVHEGARAEIAIAPEAYNNASLSLRAGAGLLGLQALGHVQLDRRHCGSLQSYDLH